MHIDEEDVKDYPDAKPMAHTLQEGEYFYFTNSDKVDFAYYGAGTRIIRT